MNAILALIAQIVPIAVQTLPIIIKGVEDLRPFVTQLYQQLSGNNTITQAQQDAIELLLTDLSNQLQQPLPEG